MPFSSLKALIQRYLLPTAIYGSAFITDAVGPALDVMLNKILRKALHTHTSTNTILMLEFTGILRPSIRIQQETISVLCRMMINPSPSVQQALLKQFDARGIRDVTWVEGFNKDDHFTKWVKSRTRSPMPLGQVAVAIKHYWIMRDIVDNGIPEAIVFEDDVVIDPEFDKIMKFPRELGLVRLGAGVLILEENDVKPSALKIMQTSNPGGCEAYWVTNDFARDFSDNSNFDYSQDEIREFIQHSLKIVMAINAVIAIQAYFIAKSKNIFSKHNNNASFPYLLM
jgi:hypothetical protein